MTFLTPERVEMRYNTLLDAFLTADRRRRGHLHFDRVYALYQLYFHNSGFSLRDVELTTFIEERMMQSPVDGSLVVDYMAVAEALRRRDMSLARKQERAALTSSPRKAAPPLEETSRHPPPPPPQPLPQPHQELQQQRRRQSQPLEDAGEQTPQKMSGRRPRHGPDGSLSGSSPTRESPPRQLQFGGVEADEGGGNAVCSLLAALEASEPTGRVFAAQLLMMCRMHGVDQSTAVLQQLMKATTGTDHRVDYIAFVAQLAALGPAASLLSAHGSPTAHAHGSPTAHAQGSPTAHGAAHGAAHGVSRGSPTRVAEESVAPWLRGGVSPQTAAHAPVGLRPAAERGAALPDGLGGGVSPPPACYPATQLPCYGLGGGVSPPRGDGREHAPQSSEDGAAGSLPAASALAASLAQLLHVFASADAQRGRRGRLPVSELKRICALYQLKVPPVLLEAALTRAASMDQGSMAAQHGGRSAKSSGPADAQEVAYADFLDELAAVAGVAG